MALIVGIVVEDVRFRDFLVPAIRRIAGDADVEVDLQTTEPVHGCSTRRLVKRLDEITPHCGLTVVGLDASAHGHGRRASSHRQKAQRLAPTIAGRSGLSLAIAAPCVEAWLLADAVALGDGIEESVGVSFKSPPRWPVPRDERTAKSDLGRVLHDGVDAVFMRNGFEYAEAIVARAALRQSANVSLADWARDFDRRLRAAARTS